MQVGAPRGREGDPDERQPGAPHQEVPAERKALLPHKERQANHQRKDDQRVPVHDK